MKFFKDKKIFITGHTGFKGAMLCYILHKFGAKIGGFGLPPLELSLYEKLGIKNIIEHDFIGDINNEQEITTAIFKTKPEIVFHMAAQAFVLESYQHPKNTWQTNVIGTLNLFEAVRKVNSVKSFVNVTTDKCYENIESNYFYTESDKLGGWDPYSASKASSEILSSSYRRSFFKNQGVQLATARAGNVIGGGDFSQNRLIPNAIRSIKENSHFIVTMPDAIRPWQHVFDALQGYLILSEKLYEDKGFDEAFNFGPERNSNITVLEVILEMQKHLPSLKYKIQLEENASHQAGLLMLDISHAKAKLGFKPKLSAKQAIEFTANWYKEFLFNGDIIQITNNQINEFFL